MIHVIKTSCRAREANLQKKLLSGARSEVTVDR